MIDYNGNVTEGVYTLNEFLASLDGPAVNESNRDEVESFRKRQDHTWMGLKDEVLNRDEPAVDAAKRLVRDGWRKGVDLMAEIADKITAPTPKVIRRRQAWREHGDDVEMQRVWSGNLENAWRTTVRDYRSGPQRVRVLIDAIESGGNGAEGMRWRGVAALKLADLLTEAGYSVQIESVISCKDSSNASKTFKLRTIVKEYETPSDLLTLAATTAMPAFFRALMHLWGLKVSQHPRAMGVSYQVRTPTAAEFPDGDESAAVFLLPRTLSDAEAASKAITEIITKLDGEE
jgi:hypothetical protein